MMSTGPIELKNANSSQLTPLRWNVPGPPRNANVENQVADVYAEIAEHGRIVEVVVLPAGLALLVGFDVDEGLAVADKPDFGDKPHGTHLVSNPGW
jgi:hypothetical protein